MFLYIVKSIKIYIYKKQYKDMVIKKYIMSVLDLDLSEYNIDYCDLVRYKDCAVLEKLAFGIVDKKAYPCIKRKKLQKLIDLIRSLKNDWYCKDCDKQSYSKAGNISHRCSIEHRAKINGKEVIICADRRCKKKFVGQDEFKQHLEDSPSCLYVSPKNQRQRAEAVVKREKQLLGFKSTMNHKWTEEEIADHNKMMRRLQIRNPDDWGTLLKHNDIGLLEFYNEEKNTPVFEAEPVREKTNEELEYERKKENEKWEYEQLLQAQKDWEREQQKFAEAEEREKLFNECNEIKVV